MAGEDGAMFFFNTNIDMVAADIAGAMQRINTELGQPLRAPALAANTAELGQLGSRLEQQARAGMDRMRAALASGVDPRAAFRQNIQETFGAIPRIMADEMAKVPNTVAMSTPVRYLAAAAGKSYINELRDTIARESPEAFAAIRSERFPIADFNKLTRTPAAFGNETSPTAFYTNQYRAEEMIRGDLGAGGSGVSKNLLAQAKLLGYTEEYMKALHAATVKVEKIDGESIATFTPTDARARLRDLGPTDETTARRLDAARSQTETAAMLKGAGGGDIVGNYRVLNGEAYKLTTLGAERVKNGLLEEQIVARQARQVEQQAAQAERLNRQQTTASARGEAANGGFAGGFAARFGRGGGSLLNSLGGQVASAASFSLGYGALFGAIGGLKDLQHEFSDYQDSLTDFQVATGSADSVTGDWIDSLGELSRVTGENLGASLDTAARGVRAFGNPLTDTLEKTRAISEATNTAATQLGLVANKALPDATGDTLAVGTAFGMQPDQLGQIVDAVANAKRSLGGDPGQISQGLASIAVSAQSAGFNLQQAASMISLVQSRTDETGLAAATRLTRIFQTTSGSTGKKLGQELGVDTNQSVRKQLEDYSKIFNAPGTTKAVKDRITSSLGGTANLRELLPVLQDGARLTQSYAEAQSNAGQGQDEFERKSNNLVGTLKKIRGDIKLIEVDLVRSDIFAPFGVLVMTLEPVLHLIDRALKLFDRMPEPIRHITAALIDLAIAAKAVAVVQNVMATRQFTRRAEAGLIQGASALTGGTIRRGGVAVAAPAALERSAAGAATEARNAEALRIAEAMQARMAAEGALTEGVAGAAAGRREAEAAQVPLIFQSAEARAAAVQAEVAGILDAIPARLAAEAELDATVTAAAEGRAAVELETTAASTAGALGGLGTIARSLINPWTLAIGALVGGAVILNKLFDSIDQKNKFNAQFADSSFALARNDGSAASTRQAAQDLRSAAGNIKRSNATWDAKGVRDDLSKQLNQQAKDLDAIGKRVAREEAGNAAKQSTSVFGQGGVVTTVDELAAGLQTLQENGAGAYGSMVALNKELANTATPSNPAFQPEQFASRLSTSALSSVRGMLPDQVEVADHSVQWATNPQTGQTYQTHFAQTKNISGNEAYARIAKDNPQSRIDKAVRDATDSLGIKPGDVLNPAQETQIARKVANAFDLSSVPKQAKKLREQLFQHLYREAAGIPETNDNNLFSVGINGVVNSVVDALGLQAPSAATLNGTGPMSAKRALSIVQPGTPNADGSQYPGLVEANQAGLANIPADDDGTKKRQTLLAQYRGWKLIVSRIRKAGDKVPYEIAKDTRDAQDAYAEAKIGQLEDLRKVEQSAAAGDPRAQKAIGQKFLQKEITAAGTNGKRLRGIMQNANDQMLALVRATLVQAEEMAKQAADDAQVGRTPANPTIDAGQPTPKQNEAQQTYEDARARRRAFDIAHGNVDSPDKGGNFATAGDTSDADKLTPAQLAARRTRSRVNPTDAVGAASADLAQSRADLARASADFDTGKITQQDLYAAQQDVAEKRQAFLQAQVDVASAAGGARAARSGDAIVSARVQMQGAAAQMKINAKGTAGWWAGLQQWYDGQWAMRQAVAAKTGAVAQAGAARTGGGLAEGRAAIIGAAAQLHAVARGTAEWWQALGTYYQSQDQMRQAVLAYKNIQDQLHGDITDPVENARDAVRAAARKLRMDSRRHAGKDVIAQDRLDVRQGQVGEESAKFQQRLSDMQTADDLGRISHQKYLQYLDHEHDRLSRIHKRTRQQQDELDTVDKAMKDAKTAMDSQFNLGDINTKGLVYQVRRFKAENAAQGAPTAAVGNTTHQTVSISINGADTAKVKTIIDGYLRIGGGQRQALTRRKV